MPLYQEDLSLCIYTSPWNEFYVNYEFHYFCLHVGEFQQHRQ